MLVTGDYQRSTQPPDDGTTHKRKELFTDLIQKIDLDETYKAGELLQRLRALTTNQVKEAAYFEADGKRYRVQVTISGRSARSIDVKSKDLNTRSFFVCLIQRRIIPIRDDRNSTNVIRHKEAQIDKLALM